MQLDSFIESPEGLTGQSPPELIIEDDEPDIEIADSQYDDEERIYNEEWPDIDEYVKSGLEAPSDESNETIEKPAGKTEKHMAAIVNKIQNNLDIKRQIKVKNTLKFLTNVSKVYRKNISTNIIVDEIACR